MSNWYDFPQYFDLAFADETETEANFLEAAAQRYAGRPVRRLLDPGCGGGRLVVEMSRRGYEVTGFDNNAAAVRLAQKRLARRKLAGKIEAGDLADFHYAPAFDMAYCTFNTFRHLLTEEAAAAHLQCVANSLQPRGLYVLGFHLLPPDASEECIERWRAQSGKTSVCITLRVVGCSRRQRWERIRICLLARRAGKIQRLASEFNLRLYTAAQVRSLLARVPELELVGVHNFDYDIESPLELDNELGDAVLVLRKREKPPRRRKK